LAQFRFRSSIFSLKFPSFTEEKISTAHVYFPYDDSWLDVRLLSIDF